MKVAGKPGYSVSPLWGGDPREPEYHDGQIVLYIFYSDPSLTLFFKAFPRRSAETGEQGIRVEPDRQIRAQLGSAWDRRVEVYARVIACIRAQDARWHWPGMDCNSAELAVDESVVPSAADVVIDRARNEGRRQANRFVPPRKVLAVQAVAMALVVGTWLPDAGFRSLLGSVAVVLSVFSLALVFEDALDAYHAFISLKLLGAIPGLKTGKIPTRGAIVLGALRMAWKANRWKYLVSFASAMGIVAMFLAWTRPGR